MPLGPSRPPVHGAAVPFGPGYKGHVLRDRAARLPLFFLLSPAHRNDLPFTYPLRRVGWVVLALPIHGVRADGAYWSKERVAFIFI